MFTELLDTIFGPLLLIKPIYAIASASFIVAFISTMAYKLLTDQEIMKKLKTDLKKHQSDMKKHREDPDKMKSVQKKAMDTNMKYMKHSMKPTLITMPIILLILPWISTNFALIPLEPNEPFDMIVHFAESVEGQIELSAIPDKLDMQQNAKPVAGTNVSFALKGPVGRYDLDFNYNGAKYSKPIIITERQKSLPKAETFENSDVVKIETNQAQLQPLGNFSIFGWHPKWLGTYILFSIAFSLGLRKVMKLS